MATFRHNNKNNPSLLDALSWTNIMPVKPLVQPSFTELFGELNFEENPNTSTTSTSTTDPMSMSSPSSSSSFGFGFEIITRKQKEDENGGWGNITEGLPVSSSYHRKSDSFSSSMNSESLQLCTEGLGFESSADVEDHSRARAEAFPPPISSIGKSGKPGVCFRSFREDGRFVLREIRIPTQEFLHACREDGRLKLHFVHPNDEDEDEEGEGEGEEKACHALFNNVSLMSCRRVKVQVGVDVLFSLLPQQKISSHTNPCTTEVSTKHPWGLTFENIRSC